MLLFSLQNTCYTKQKKKPRDSFFFYIIIFFLWNRGREVGNKKEKIEFFYNIIF